jgi:hypothetical protein
VVLPYEGGWEAHNLFMRTGVHLGLEALAAGEAREAVRHLEASKTYPEHLGTGEPYDVDVRMQDYLEYLAWSRTGSRGRAREALERVVAWTRQHGTGGSHHLFGLLALRESGAVEEAERLRRELEERFGGNPDVRWAIAVYTGDAAEAERLAVELLGNPRFGIQITAAGAIMP